MLFFLQLSILLVIGFVPRSATRKLADDPAARCTQNRQFLSANMAMLLLGAGALGSLFMLSLVLVNLWGYSQLEAALAMTADRRLRHDSRGRSSARAPTTSRPTASRCRRCCLMALGLIWFSFLPSTYEGQLDYWLVLPGVA